MTYPSTNLLLSSLILTCLFWTQQVRSKYWPTLGLSDGKRSISETSLRSGGTSGLLRNASQTSRRGRQRDENGSKETTTSNSSHRKSTDSSPINYADIGGFSDYSSSPDKISCLPTTVLVHECKLHAERWRLNGLGSNLGTQPHTHVLYWLTDP